MMSDREIIKEDLEKYPTNAVDRFKVKHPYSHSRVLRLIKKSKQDVLDKLSNFNLVIFENTNVECKKCNDNYTVMFEPKRPYAVKIEDMFCFDCLQKKLKGEGK